MIIESNNVSTIIPADLLSTFCVLTKASKTETKCENSAKLVSSKSFIKLNMLNIHSVLFMVVMPDYMTAKTTG